MDNRNTIPQGEEDFIPDEHKGAVRLVLQDINYLKTLDDALDFFNRMPKRAQDIYIEEAGKVR